MTYASLVINVRRFLQDPGALHWSNLDIGALLDEAAKQLQSELKILKNRTSLSLVLNQRSYALAANVLAVDELEYSDSGSVKKIPGQVYDVFREAKLPLAGTIPRRYTTVDDDQTILLAPVPDTAAPTTTLTGAHSSTVTTLTVGSTTNFYTEGRVIVESEVMSYTGKTATTLTGVTRAIEGTTAASHADAITVTARNLLVYGVRRFLDREMRTYYTTGTVVVTNASKTVTGTSTSWTNNVSAGNWIGITTNVTRIDPSVWYEIDTVDSTTQVTLKNNYNQPNASTQSYIISSVNPFPNQYDGFLLAFAKGMALEKEGAYREAQAHWGFAERALKVAQAGASKPDVLLYPRGRHDRGWRRGGYMVPSGGSTYDTT